MVKKKKVLWLVSIGIIVGCIVYLGIKQQIQSNHTVKVQEEVERVYQLNTVTKVAYEDEKVTVLTKQGEGWVNPDAPSLKYNQTLVQQWITELQQIETKETIKNVHDESLYGIHEDSIRITLYDDMEVEQTIWIGDIIEAEDSLYIKSDVEKTLYVLPYHKVKKLINNPASLVDCREVLDIPSINQITLTYPDDEIQIKKGQKWYLQDYYTVPSYLNEEKMAEWVSSLEEMNILNYVESSGDLELYGLQTPKVVLTLNEQLKIAFGSKSEQTAYVTINDSDEVYAINQEAYYAVTHFKPYDMLDKQVVQCPIETVDTIILENPQGTFTFNFADPKSVIGQKDLTVEEKQVWFDKIGASIYIEALLQNPNIEQKEDRKAEATIQYLLKDGGTIQMEFIPYDINYYILRYNGQIQFAVNKGKITLLFNELTQFTKS